MTNLPLLFITFHKGNEMFCKFVNIFKQKEAETRAKVMKSLAGLEEGQKLTGCSKSLFVYCNLQIILLFFIFIQF